VGAAQRVGAALSWLSRLSWVLGRIPDSERFAQEALATLEPLPACSELAMGYSSVAQLRMLGDDVAGAQLWGRKALELARALGDRGVECHALNNLGTALMLAGRVDDGTAQLERSLNLALDMDDPEHVPRAYANLGSVAVRQRRFADADRYLHLGIAFCTERDLDSSLLYLSAWLARLLAEQGRWDAARQASRDVLRHPRLSPVSRLPALVVTAQVAIRRGEPDAHPALDEALGLAELTGEAQRLMPVVFARAEAAWTIGQSITAELDRIPTPANLGPWDSGELAWWRRRGGKPDVVSGSFAVPFALMLSGRSAAAALAWAEIGCQFWQALALAESESAADVRVGVEALRSMGADATVRALLRDMHAQGKPLPRGPRPSSRANPAGLTARELEVLALLARGLSNAEIAGRLFLSEKTASHHVSAILRKLGEPTRARAAAAAVRLGIGPT
jgi:DNA-binding CsgD family transcriptional regulator/Tfp pilus assembly protein PilF